MCWMEKRWLEGGGSTAPTKGRWGSKEMRVRREEKEKAAAAWRVRRVEWEERVRRERQEAVERRVQQLKCSC